MTRIDIPTILTGLLLLAAAAGAQCTGGDPGDGSCTLTLNGMVPDSAGQVTVPPCGLASFEFTDPTGNKPLIVLAGTPDCAGFPTPWGGSIDLTGVTVVIDGFGFSVGALDYFGNTNLVLAFGLNPAMAGTTLPAIQGLFSPGPGVFDNTAMIEGTLPTTITTTYGNLNSPGTILVGDDDSITYPLCQPITIYGTSYTTLFIGSNGQINFGAGSNDFTTSMPEFFSGHLTGAPEVAAQWADYNRSSSSGTIHVVEDLAIGSVLVEYLNQDWWDSQTPAGTHSVEFNAVGPNTLVLDTSGVIAGVSGIDRDPVAGVSSGTNAADVDLTTGTGVPVSLIGYTSAGASESVGQTYDPASPLIETTTWIDSVGNGTWVVL